MANKYINIPVDEKTYRGVQALCSIYEMGQRGMGAMVRKLVKAELEQTRTQGLLTNGLLSVLAAFNPEADELEPGDQDTAQA